MSLSPHAHAAAFGLDSLDSFLFVDSVPPGEIPPAQEGGANLPDAAGAGLGAAEGAVDTELFAGGEDGPDLPDPPAAPPAPDLHAESGGLSDLIGPSELILIDAPAFAKGGNGGGGGGGKPSPGGGGGGGGGGGSSGGTTEPVVSSYLSGQDTPGGYNIEITFKGSWTAALQQSFFDASELISDMITGDVQDVFFRGKVIDDLSIEAKLSSIDGVGGVLGQAGPTAIRTADYLPAAGSMEFDVADADNFDGMGLFNDIVFHEMMHCLGFGTMWGASYMNLVQDVSAAKDGSDLRFIGTNATDEYQFDFLADGTKQHTGSDSDPGSGVPVESNFGAGTRGGHWNDGEALEAGQTSDSQLGFANEIMTGFINGSNYLSDVTIAALQDMGYDTVYDGQHGSATDVADAVLDVQTTDIFAV